MSSLSDIVPKRVRVLADSITNGMRVTPSAEVYGTKPHNVAFKAQQRMKN